MLQKINIPMSTQSIQRIKERTKQRGFKSIDDYIIFLIKNDNNHISEIKNFNY